MTALERFRSRKDLIGLSSGKDLNRLRSRKCTHRRQRSIAARRHNGLNRLSHRRIMSHRGQKLRPDSRSNPRNKNNHRNRSNPRHNKGNNHRRNNNNKNNIHLSKRLKRHLRPRLRRPQQTTQSLRSSVFKPMSWILWQMSKTLLAPKKTKDIFT